MKITYDVKGMHCQSCEILVTDELKEIKGIKDAIASHKKGTITVTLNPDLVSNDQIKKIIKKQGYEV